MSVFKSIKGTFAAGLKSITSSHANKPDINQGIIKSSVDFDAGADLLAKYQEIWKELHDTCQENARKAEDIDGMVTDLHVKYDRQQEVMSRLHECVGSLPILVSQLQQATDLLASLEEDYEKVNTALVQFEDVIEERELLTAQVIDTKKLSEYNQRKQDELESCKVNLARDHARKINEYEKKKKNIQKEREEAFKDAFEDDMFQYKTFGHVDKVSISSSEGSKKLNIADISFDGEEDDMDDFLGSTEVTPSNENFPDSTEETENVFSEDDYIPKQEEESEFLKSGDTAASDSDAENKHVSHVNREQQQNTIQTWINNSNHHGDMKGSEDKNEDCKSDNDEKKESNDNIGSGGDINQPSPENS